MGLGHLFIKHPALMVRNEMLDVFSNWLAPPREARKEWRNDGGPVLRLQVLQVNYTPNNRMSAVGFNLLSCFHSSSLRLFLFFAN